MFLLYLYYFCSLFKKISMTIPKVTMTMQVNNVWKCATIRILIKQNFKVTIATRRKPITFASPMSSVHTDPLADERMLARMKHSDPMDVAAWMEVRLCVESVLKFSSFSFLSFFLSFFFSHLLKLLSSSTYFSKKKKNRRMRTQFQWIVFHLYLCKWFQWTQLWNK